MNRAIFREYDIRGEAERDLTDDMARNIGRAFGSRLASKGKNNITLGRDCRLSSDRLRDAVLQGLLDAGMRVIDIGVVPTPVLYFSLYQWNTDGGVMITGSHNPPQYNGFKLCDGKESLHGPEIQEVAGIIEKKKFEAGQGSVSIRNPLPEYKAMLLEKFKLPRSVRVVIDCGNGTSSVVAAEIIERLGCQVTPLFCEMDGHFPNHHPDPTIESNLQDLVRRVMRDKPEVGIAFDGDADRIGAIDDQGKVLWGDQLLILYSRDILKKQPGATIISEVKCSQNLFDDIAKHGGRAIMWKAGHSLIKAKMKEEHAAAAGEMSGHMFFADRYYGYDDAIYAACRLLEILAQSDQPLSAMLSDVPKTYTTPEIRVDTDESKKFKIVEEATRYFSEHYKTITVDGVRILFEDAAWGLIRASNTQPVLVLRFEAKEQKQLNEIRKLVEGKLAEISASV
ncbi:MAG TPA: phosphomannomutase/phosphoglucomutase [Acidobacteriota bacterium]|nr:phosphomannomutase/phosphoglucomutase [Acidobacteriota bacterium]